MYGSLLAAPDRLWTRGEVMARDCPVPAVPGVYGWHFTAAPSGELPAGRLLYVGISPRRMSERPSSQHLRKRIRYHYRGNAYGSTLRLTLGCLLGLELRRVGSGTRLTFTHKGEAALTEWMHEHARVCWIEHPEPWTVESALLQELDLPLNLDQNRHNAFHARLTALRAEARRRARELPIAT
ncbi:hypothetical protein GCM10023085_62360 [Actinomadura viridis]|uniref:GIY-YIG catalytic domain-containing protein n=1 Tax=Actinomadura viridis TaxID=58110 RepID=A0A931D7X7_9ACTN|nr:hypothetical protein [Actinomadura viridis]MBG6086084.1 hypothetical protein [Actinomadura viridis]